MFIDVDLINLEYIRIMEYSPAAKTVMESGDNWHGKMSMTYH